MKNSRGAATSCAKVSGRSGVREPKQYRHGQMRWQELRKLVADAYERLAERKGGYR